MIELHQDALTGEGMVSEISLAFHRGAQGFAGLRDTWRQIESSLSGKLFFTWPLPSSMSWRNGRPELQYSGEPDVAAHEGQD